MLAHLVDDAKTTQLGFIRHLVAASFDFDHCNSSGILRERADNLKHTLAEFRAVLGRTTSAPAPQSTRLVEIFVHAEDIRRPLGINYGDPAAHVSTALLHQVKTKVSQGGGKERAQGLTGSRFLALVVMFRSSSGVWG